MLPGVVLAASLSLVVPAHAATIQVTTAEDVASGGSNCSLREAMIAANEDATPPGSNCTAGTAGGNTIDLPAGEYKLTIEKAGVDGASSGDLNITAPTTIAGAGATTTKIDQTKADRVIAVESSGVHISNVAIAKGALATGDGGGIFVGPDDTLTLSSSRVTESEAQLGGGIFVSEGAEATIEKSASDDNHASIEGGGLGNEGTAALQDATIDENTAKYLGGGIYIADSATAALSGGEVAGNEAPDEDGGGIFSFGRLTATGTTITKNSSPVGGGLGLEGPSTLTNDKVTANTAEGLGGGIYTDALTTLTNTTVAENRATEPGSRGGGIAFEGSMSVLLKIEGSTIGPHNFAYDGDGLYLRGEANYPATARLTRSTIAENGAINSELGGGLYLAGNVEAVLHDVTVAENSASDMGSEGGNVYAEAASRLTWRNSLVANDLSGGNCYVLGSTTSLGGDEEYATGTECQFKNAHDTKGPELEPSQLLSLANNGGPTETMALPAGAPAVNSGFGCEPTDQRGVPRPQGPACDAGAYELITAPIVSDLAESANTWRTGGTLAHITSRARPRLGTTFSFSLNEQATVTLDFTHRLNGREVHGRCVAKRKRNAKHKHCQRTVTDGTIRFTGHSGINHVAFQGRISRTTKLGPGRHTLIVTATGAAGENVAGGSLHFTIVAG